MRFIRVALLVMLLSLATMVAVPSQPTSASTAYDAAVDLTFPVGGPTTFRDDYDACRSGCSRYHRATDIMAPYGVLTYAAVGGTITFITGIDGPVPDYGYMIRISGDDSRAYSYIHLGRQDLGPDSAYLPGIVRGVRVERGQPIGITGCSGNASCSAPHLHFEIVDENVTDPYGTNRMNPYASLVSAVDRGDLPSGTGSRFSDVALSDRHWEDIEWLAEREITRGCDPPTNSRFCPRDVVTRAQMAAFLVRALDLREDSGIRFEDVLPGSTFELDIDRLATAGITRGCNPPTNDRFCPDVAVSRDQMAAFIARGVGLPAASHSNFADVPRASTFAADIDRLAAAGVTRGCNPPTNDRYCPASDVTREQMASFLRRAQQR